MRKIISLCIIGILVAASLLGLIMLESNIVSAGTTWYVGSGLGNDSSTITGGIALASDGHTVFVYAGTYAENVVVDRSINLTGEYKDSTIIDGGGGNGIHVITDYVNITGFTVTNSNYALYLQPSSNSTISNNNISGNSYGLHIRESSADNIVSNNTVSYNSVNGIYFSKVYNTIIENNIISQSGGNGIYLLAQSFNITISENKIFENSRGINHISSANCTISSNNISRNNYGIWVSNAVNSTITLNNLYSNIFFGMTFTSSNDDTSNENQWDNGYPEGGNYWSDYSGMDLNSTALQNVPPSDGIGDTPYVIDVDSQDNYPKMKGFGNYLYLYPGWNLISIPLIQSNNDLDSVLSSIKGSYDAVQWFNASDGSDPWKHNHTAKSPFLNDLDKINHLMGFWIHITEPDGILFEYFGNIPSANQTITLYNGWNMVGYPSNSTRSRTYALNNLTFQTEVDAIWDYDTATGRWKKVEASDYFKIGKGYWIHAKTQCEWEVPL
jgi:parallel beta-helix repeat protein